MVHDARLHGTRDSTPPLGASFTNAGRKTGIPPCCSGLQVQGTAISPPSAANVFALYCTLNRSGTQRPFRPAGIFQPAAPLLRLARKLFNCVQRRLPHERPRVACKGLDQRQQIVPLLLCGEHGRLRDQPAPAVLVFPNQRERRL